jgi:small-conductance mechanosensitive channel
MGASTANLLTASPSAIESGMQLTFAVAAGLILIALVIAFAGQKLLKNLSK